MDKNVRPMTFLCATASGDGDGDAAELHTMWLWTVWMWVGNPGILKKKGRERESETNVMLSTIAVSLIELTNGVANAPESHDNDSGSLRRCTHTHTNRLKA